MFKKVGFRQRPVVLLSFPQPFLRGASCLCFLVLYCSSRLGTALCLFRQLATAVLKDPLFASP
jgi:hypothetical protein